MLCSYYILLYLILITVCFLYIVEFFKFFEMIYLCLENKINSKCGKIVIYYPCIHLWFTGSLLFSILKISIMRSGRFPNFIHIYPEASLPKILFAVSGTLYVMLHEATLKSYHTYSTCAPRVAISTYRPFTQPLIIAHLFVVAYTIK